MRLSSVVALCMLAAPIPAVAATINLSLTGDPTTGAAGASVDNGVAYQTYNFILTGYQPFMIEQGDTIAFDIAFTSPFLVPGGTASQFVGVNFFEAIVDPDTDDTAIVGIDGQSSGAITAFAQSVGITAPRDAGCGNCIVAIFDNEGNPFTLSGLTGVLNVDILNGTHSVDYISFSYQVGNAVDPVPEPASWAMMAGGFGLIGGALRHRRRATLRVA